MSAATASRNYGSATQTMTAPSSNHHQLYPTPHSSTGTTINNTSTRTNATGLHQSSSAPRGTYSYPLKTAGDSWSIKNEGDKQVIVIEDTPPPTAGSSSTATIQHSRPSTASTSTKGAKKARPNGYPADAYQVNNLHYPPPNLAGTSSSSAYAQSSYAPVAPAKASAASSGKRKYNEVNDPAAVVGYYFFRSVIDLSCDEPKY